MSLRMRTARDPIGLVVDYLTYRELHSITGSLTQQHLLIPAEMQYPGKDQGDSFLGLDVAISKKPDTLIVY
jgi:hypothetical protein